MDPEGVQFIELKPVLYKPSNEEAMDTSQDSHSPERILSDDNVDIDKLYEENKHFLNSNDDDGAESINTENTEFKVNKLYRENEHFLNSQMYSERDFNDFPSREFVEMNEQVESYMLENKVFEKVFNNETNFNDTKSVMSVDVKTDIASIKGYMGEEVSKRHYYMLIQNNNTLLNDAQQFRNRLMEKLAYIESKLKDLEQSKEDTNKQNFAKRFFTFRKGYFIDEDSFPAPLNSDARRMCGMDLVPNYVIQGQRWTMLHMEKLKKEISKHILEKKCEELKKMKNALATTKPNSKTAQLAKQYSDLETQLEYLKTLPENQVPLHGKNVSIDWDLIAARVRPEVNAEFAPMVETGDDRRRMWELCLAPTINQKPWSKEEDDKLEKLAKKNNYQDWDKVAKAMRTNRTGFQAFTHYQLKHPRESHLPWRQKEDVILLEHISKCRHDTFRHVNSLMALCLRFPKRSRTEIKSRLTELKNSMLTTSRSIKKGVFNDWEVRLMETCIKQGLNFKTIAQLLGNRTAAQVRDKMSRKYSAHVPLQQKRKGLFSMEEDNKLLSLAVKYGIKSWSFIAKKMKNRDRTQCRHRYNNIITNIKKGTTFSSKKLEPDVKENVKEDKQETLDEMLKLLDNEPLDVVYAKRKQQQKRTAKPNAAGYYYPRCKAYQRKYQYHTKADDMISDYFAHAGSIPRTTQMAIKPEIMKKHYTGDALLALLNYLEMEPAAELMYSYEKGKNSDISKYWNTADYPFVMEWYRNKVEEMDEIKERGLNYDNAAGGEESCHDIDLELPDYNLRSALYMKILDELSIYFGNRYSINSMLSSDIDFYRSNIVHAPIQSKLIHTRLVISNNGATTCNTSQVVHYEASEYFLPPSGVTLEALQMYEKFQAETLVQDETIRDSFTRDHPNPNVRDTCEGNAAKLLFESRLKCLLTASHTLIGGDRLELFH